MLEITNLQIKRGSLTVADNVSFCLEKGKIYSILGPNGAGKSSLIKAIFGLLPYQGQIRFDNQELTAKSLRHWRKRIGYMPQDTAVEASLTVLEVILLGRVDQLHFHIDDNLLQEASEIMQRLNITHLAHLDIMQLSGGQRQMVMFAQVLLHKPEILLLDEPVSALDMYHQLNLLEQVSQYSKDNQLITLMVLHDLSLAAQFSDEVILLGQGKIEKGEPKSLLLPEKIHQLYQVNIEVLYDRNGQPVIRPLRQLLSTK